MLIMKISWLVITAFYECIRIVYFISIQSYFALKNAFDIILLVRGMSSNQSCSVFSVWLFRTYGRFGNFYTL